MHGARPAGNKRKGIIVINGVPCAVQAAGMVGLRWAAGGTVTKNYPKKQRDLKRFSGLGLRFSASGSGSGFLGLELGSGLGNIDVGFSCKCLILVI